MAAENWRQVHGTRNALKVHSEQQQLNCRKSVCKNCFWIWSLLPKLETRQAYYVYAVRFMWFNYMRARGGVVQEILLRRWNFPDVKEAK